MGISVKNIVVRSCVIGGKPPRTPLGELTTLERGKLSSDPAPRRLRRLDCLAPSPGFVNIMIFSKISKMSRISRYIRHVSDIFDTFKNALVKMVGQLRKLLNHVKIVKHSIQHYLTFQQPRDLHCLQKGTKTMQFI